MNLLFWISGLIFLSLLVLVHEWGHFFVARLCKIDVQTFSVGLGPKLFSRTKNGTEFRFSLIPLGGYCRLKGEDSFRRAVEKKEPGLPAEPGSFFSAPPLHKFFIALAGPAANLLFALFLGMLLFMWGIRKPSYSTKINLPDSYRTQQEREKLFPEGNPAVQAGLRRGDIILTVNGKAVKTFRELDELFSLAPLKTFSLSILRKGEKISLPFKTGISRETGQGLSGLLPWLPPLIEKVIPGSAAEAAGLKPGDRFREINGIPTENTADVRYRIKMSRDASIRISFERNGRILKTWGLLKKNPKGEKILGVYFKIPEQTIQTFNPFKALYYGAGETRHWLSFYAESLFLVLRSSRPFQSLVGPLRLPYAIGEMTTGNLVKSGFRTGIPSLLRFLIFINTALLFMNLLPVPVLDGGQALLFLLEALRRKTFSPKSIYYYYVTGTVMMLFLLVLALGNDIRSFFPQAQ